MTRTLRFSFLVLMVASATTRAHAAEICGNGIDDDANNLTDEGCWNLSSGQCESPLSCEETGSVSPKKGTLRYSLPPDVAPKVPYGPGIGFRRTYLSQYEPGAGAAVWKTPLGDHWHHNYMTWITKTGSGSSAVLVLHTSQGQDVRAPWKSTDATYYNFQPQAGYHVQYLRQNIATGDYEIRFLSGTTLTYSSTGRLSEVFETVGSSQPKVSLTYDGNGQVSTVMDASGTRRLLFNYTSNRLSSINFQIYISGSWSTQHTTSYDYTAGVARDATSNLFVPTGAAQWSDLLQGTGLANPSSTWLSQESAGTLSDAFGARTATPTGTVSHNVTVSGWSRKGVVVANGNTGRFSIPSADPSTTSLMFVQYLGNTGIGTVGGVNRIGNTATAEQARFQTTLFPTRLRTQAQSGANTVTGSSNAAGSILVITKLDRSRSELVVYTDRGEVLRPTYSAPAASSASYLLGDGVSASGAAMVYGALFTGTAAELSDSQVSLLMKRLTVGPGLSAVTIGGEVAQEYVYSSAGDLTQINDASGNRLMGFSYASATPGKVALIETPRGTVGFEFAATRSGCSGADKTVLYFNKGNALSCNVDGDCGSGFLCGGKTGSGATGSCFRAARCMTVSSPNEDVVTSVTALGPPSESCEGACTEVSQYVWNTTGGGGAPILDLKATQDPAGYYVTRTFDTNGLVTKATYGDQDNNPDNGNSSREVYYFYDSTFPGKLKEIRRKSDLSASASSCSASVTTGCARTEYTYWSTGRLKEIKRSGSTLDSSGAVVSFGPLVTTFTYDAQNRLTQIDGPLSGSNDVTVFEYFASSGSVLKDGFVQNTKRKKDTSNYITTTVLDYDFWGNPKAIRTPDTDASHANGTLTCLTFSAARGHLTQRREAMAGQTSCGDVGGDDLTTTWTRDGALRLTQLLRPDGSSYFYGYDTRSRLQTIKRRDNSTEGSSGDTQTLVYDEDGLMTSIETRDSAGTLTAEQDYVYFDSRKLQKIINPVDSTKFTGLAYDSRGLLQEITGANNIGKTVFNRDTGTAAGREARVTSVDKYKDSTNSDTWSLIYSWLGAQTQVTDEDSKAVQTLVDDLGRTVKLVSADMTHPTLFLYDDANRLVTKIEAFGAGGGAQLTHTFTYDNADRPLNIDYHEACPTGTAQAEVQRVYDAPPVSCPVMGGCLRTGGRLAWVKSKLMCSSAYSGSDGSWDQQTFYSYDDAGRVIREDVVYDGTFGTPGSTTASSQHAWTKLSQLASYTTPSGTAIGASYNGSGNSDSDRVDFLWRTNTSSKVIQNVKWFPFGPLKEYEQMNQVAGVTQMTQISRNLAYRITNIAMKPVTGGTATFQTAITEDAKGRVTSRVYTGGATGMQNSYFIYDDQDRLICETTNSVGSCPTSGSNIKNSRTTPYFTSAGDWLELLRPVPGSTGLMNNFNPSGYGSSHQVTSVVQSDGSPVLGTTAFAYDARGNRTSDDNTSTLTNDRRDYTYDGRGNLINVHGKYFTGGTWRDYDVGSAFDHKNRRVYKFFLDNTTSVRSEWWFYYDGLDRLTEVLYYPNAASATTYTLFHLSWLENRSVSFAQTDYPSATVSKRYANLDEAGRPIDMWSWPASGNAARVWAIDSGAWGVDTNLVGPSIYQPLLFAGQYVDEEAVASNNGGSQHRPPLAANGYRTYDPFTGGFLQVDPAAPNSWSTYAYADNDPIGHADPDGRLALFINVSDGFVNLCGSTTLEEYAESNVGGGIDKNQLDCAAEAKHGFGVIGDGGPVIDACGWGFLKCTDLCIGPFCPNLDSEVPPIDDGFPRCPEPPIDAHDDICSFLPGEYLGCPSQMAASAYPQCSDCIRSCSEKFKWDCYNYGAGACAACQELSAFSVRKCILSSCSEHCSPETIDTWFDPPLASDPRM